MTQNRMAAAGPEWRRHAKRRFGVSLLVAIAALLVQTAQAAAERVLIVAPSGEKGHGWLFGSGSQDDRRCWVATPAHAIKDPFTGGLEAFAFTDMAGRAGKSAQPVGVADVAGAIAAAGGVTDLAFAPVAFGREPGNCLSRLGLNTLAYDTALRASPTLTIFNLLPTSFGTFETKVDAGGIGDAEGRLQLGPVPPDIADRYLKRGLSGAVAEATVRESIVPFAMVLDIGQETRTAIALRFDRLRAAFDLVEQRFTSSSDPSDGSEPKLELVSVEGVQTDSVAAADRLLSDGDCWRPVGNPGEKQIRIVMRFGDSGQAARSLTIDQQDDCQAPGARIALDARRGGEVQWTYLADCKRPLPGGAFQCRFDIRGPRQLRLRILADDPVQMGLMSLR